MKLPTAEQWLEIAEAFDTPKENQTERQQKITDIWLCDALDALGLEGTIICMTLNPDQKDAGYSWTDSFTRCDGDYDFDGCELRSIFAGLMAAMGTQGFKKFYDWCITEAGDMADMVEGV